MHKVNKVKYKILGSKIRGGLGRCRPDHNLTQTEPVEQNPSSIRRSKMHHLCDLYGGQCFEYKINLRNALNYRYR